VVKNPVILEVLNQSSMPKSLAPVISQQRHRKRVSVAGEYDVNGVKLRMSRRSARSLESNYSLDRANEAASRQARAQTLSPVPGSS